QPAGYEVAARPERNPGRQVVAVDRAPLAIHDEITFDLDDEQRWEVRALKRLHQRAKDGVVERQRRPIDHLSDRARLEQLVDLADLAGGIGLVDRFGMPAQGQPRGVDTDAEFPPDVDERAVADERQPNIANGREFAMRYQQPDGGGIDVLATHEVFLAHVAPAECNDDAEAPVG